ncbi:ABC transporter, substrate-binding protein, aliphatic sulfonates family [Desulfosarcina cetonica]|uniref:ABC transporter substrate-binding protein n=1 Tax=Desulfosarcina cetonica TaxID=90730 RepID=UPI0006D0E7A7|nr:ABC transporter substrate-binding protein [Desulfosarcina cetonica]VTR66023.1 ABC transporter, substrate-binding protein, aliphatic sulfonates family [Desulfosarcina cetonica]
MKKRSLIAIIVFFVWAGFCFPGLAAQPIRIGYLQGDLHQLACWTALEKGYFNDQGLDVRVGGIFKAGPEEMIAFAAGDLDVGYVGEAPATTAVANNKTAVRVLAQVNTEGSAIVVNRLLDANNLADMRGKTIAIPGHSTVQDFLLQKERTKYNLTETDLKTIVVKPPEMIGALRTGQIDGFIVWESFVSKAVTLKAGKILASSHDIWPDHPCCVLAAHRRFLEKCPEDAVKIVRAHVRATHFIGQHPEQAIDIGVKYSGMDRETVALAMKNITYTVVPSIDGEIEYVAFLNKIGYIRVPDAKAFVKDFIDTTILADVLTEEKTD